MLFGIRTQGVASLALGYALVGLSARALSVVSQGKRLLAFSPLRLPLLRFGRAVRGDRRAGCPSWRVGCPFAVRARRRA